ncbi:TPA_asm: hypothetical protein G0I59_24940 [Salmonella enterica]|nr:hypothetical protein [Salmonella enterica]
MRVLEVVAKLRLHWKDRFGDMSRTRLLPRLVNLPGLTNLRKSHLPGWFFRLKIEVNTSPSSTSTTASVVC